MLVKGQKAGKNNVLLPGQIYMYIYWINQFEFPSCYRILEGVIHLYPGIKQTGFSN